MGAKRESKGIAVMGRMGINPQLVDVISACSEGRESPALVSSPHYACSRAAQTPLPEALYVSTCPLGMEPSTPPGERFPRHQADGQTILCSALLKCTLAGYERKTFDNIRGFVRAQIRRRQMSYFALPRRNFIPLSSRVSEVFLTP